MNTIRTTISIDENLHRQLVLQAFNSGVSFNQLVNSKLTDKKLEEKSSLESDVAFFRKLGKKTGKINWVKLIREQREKDFHGHN